MAVKKHKLEQAIDEDFCLLGVVSDEVDYRFCWRLNLELGTDFRREEDLHLYHKKLESEQSFPLFLHSDKLAFLTYRIIGNRRDESVFLDELKNLDYLIHIQGEIYPDAIGEFIGKVSAVQEVRMCVPVDLLKLKNRDRLYLW